MATSAPSRQAEFHATIANDPVRFATEILHFQPWTKQAEILESVRDHPKTAVRSANGVGKTAIAAQAVLWFLLAYPDSRVITTATTFGQVRNTIWPEIHKALAKAPAGLYKSASLTRLDMGLNWFAVGLSTDEPERFAGHHAPHLLLVVDEASGVAEDIFEASAGFMTSAGGRVLLISNPTRPSGTFYRAFHAERESWNCISISAFDSPNLTGEVVSPATAAALTTRAWVEEKARDWGEDSPLYQVRVLGNFPTRSDEQVIDLARIEAAFARTDVVPPRSISEVVIACDPARHGSDETVIVVREGNCARIVRAYQGRDTTYTAGAIMDAKRELSARGMDCVVVVDEPGIGGPLIDQLRAQGVRAQAFNGGGRPHDPSLFVNRRSEQWFMFGAVLDDLNIEPDEQLAADLVAPKYDYDIKMRKVVEQKKVTKKRLGRSPDRADAMLMAFAGGAPMGADFVDSAWLDGDG